MALGIRDYYLFIRYLDFKACVEQGLSHVCVCIMTMARAKVSSCGCQGFTQTLLLFSPRDLCAHRSSALLSLPCYPFSSRGLPAFPRKPFPLPSPKLFQPLHYASALPPSQGCWQLSPDAFPAFPLCQQLFHLPSTGEWGLFRKQLCRRCFSAKFSRKFLPVCG